MQTHRHQDILSLLPVTHPVDSPNHHLQRSRAPLSTLRPYHQNNTPTPPDEVLEMTKTNARRKDKPSPPYNDGRQPPVTPTHHQPLRRSNPPPSSPLPPTRTTTHTTPQPIGRHRNIGSPPSPPPSLPPCTTKHAVPHVVCVSPTSNMTCSRSGGGYATHPSIRPC